ncbi:MAG: hypothetical protein AMS20_07340 [Gemmatimonas sp. SG8_28]|nr:MAG: hypothetical protein AMS20_07340 [Gemmatimonas sp. SG8_28]
MIGFLNPLLLVGLALAGLPPLLHLLGRRQPPTVEFPALRYLSAAEREHSRRLKLRNLLLMLLRIAMIALVVLAAARPVVRTGAGGSHPPTSLVLIVDNSLSSGAVVGGRTVLDSLRRRALDVLERAGPDDRLWLMVADGIPERVTVDAARSRLGALAAWPVRLDLGDAVRVAAAALAEAGPPREIVVVSDLQSSAVTVGAPVAVPVLALAPPELPENASVDAAQPEPGVWTRSGQVVVEIGGDATQPRAVRLLLDGAESDRTVAHAQSRVVLRSASRRPGWTVGEVRLDPDELRADDARFFAVRVTGPVGVRVTGDVGHFVHEGVGVLVEGGALDEGEEVRLSDGLAPGPVVVIPPADPALVGALNRALERRGVAWRLGELVDGEWTLDREDWGAASVPVYRRFVLIGEGDVLATVAGEPWLVRDGDVTLLASRLEPAWTALAASAAFLPFLEDLVSRVALRQGETVEATAGAPAAVPLGATALLLPGGPVPVSGGRSQAAPSEPGVYFAIGAAGDTVGAIVVNHDHRESRLMQADAGQAQAALGNGAQVLADAAFERELFGAARRAELTTLLLIAALLAALAELILATATARAVSP